MKLSKMYNPPHPGITLREDVLPALSRVLNGKAAISPEMALRLEQWLGVNNGGSASLWLGQQSAYDLWKTRKSLKLHIKHAAIPKQLCFA